MENVEIFDGIGDYRKKLSNNYFKIICVAGTIDGFPKINQLNLYENIVEQLLCIKQKIKTSKITNLNIYYLKNIPINFSCIQIITKMFPNYEIKLYLN